MTRAARAVINLSALQHNLQKAISAAPRCQQFAVIKANAYGHGMVPIAQALKNADGFGVASVEEALELKAEKISQPILLLEGFFHANELTQIIQHNLQIVVHNEEQVSELEKFSKNSPGDQSLIVWLKVDTGMHRLGFNPDDVEGIYQRLIACDLVNNSIKLMTHLASADDFHNQATQLQLDNFRNILPEQEIERSVANSAGILGWIASHRDLVRPGILLYGVSPFINETGADRGLLPVMTLTSEVIAIKQCLKGDAVGYGGDWVCPEDMTIGVVGIGYGDGYPRHAKEGTPVLINGIRTPLVGRVSMDMVCIDLRKNPDVIVGSSVVLWGENLPAEEIAESANTIAYDLFCGVTSRVPRDYISPGSEEDENG